MATFHKQACPLCDSDAEYCWVDAENRKYLSARSGYFQLSKRAEQVLADRYASRKSTYAALARQAPEEHPLFVRIPSHEQRQQSADELQATHVPKSELPPNCR